MVESGTETPPGRAGGFPWRLLAVTAPIVAVVLMLLPNIGPVFRVFSLPSGSMAPGLAAGSVVIASRASYGYSRYSFDGFNLPIAGRWPAGRPKRGDVIVFRLTRNRRVHYIKRVIGLPGDRIAHRNGRVELNGKPLEVTPANIRLPRASRGTRAGQPFMEKLADGVSYPVLLSPGGGRFDTVPEIVVPVGHVYVLGDNRGNSTDSRMRGMVGFVPLDHVVGKVLTSWRP